MGKIITPGFEKLFKDYPLYSQGYSECALAIAKLHDNDFKNILLLLEYDSESKKVFCFHLERFDVDKKKLLTRYYGEFVSRNIAELEKTGDFIQDFNFQPVSLWECFRDRDSLLSVNSQDVVVLSDFEPVDQTVEEIINNSGKMKYVFQLNLCIDTYNTVFSTMYLN